MQFKPANCVVCLTSIKLREFLCASCEQEILRLNNYCRRCGAINHSQQEFCGECLRQTPPYDNFWSAFEYQYPIDWLIKRFKFSGDLALGRLLAKLWLKNFVGQNELPECIIPVPLHGRKIWQRGFNQSWELAKLIARDLNIAYNCTSIIKVKSTLPQVGLSEKLRRCNLQQAFKLQNELPYQHVAIFDDVMTTGSTIAEISKILKANGVKRITIWTVARSALSI